MIQTPSFRDDGQRALVNGASRGIGSAVVVALAWVGAAVTLLARSLEELYQGCDSIRESGGTCDLIALDVTDADAVRTEMGQLLPFQILVNNAGVSRLKPMVDPQDDGIHAVLNLNVKAVSHVTRAVVKGLLDAGQRGSIMYISSQMGHVGSPNRSIYCASKHAIQGMSNTLALAWELESAGNHVKTFCRHSSRPT
jgi:short-subunit dehydrogenase